VLLERVNRVLKFTVRTSRIIIIIIITVQPSPTIYWLNNYAVL